MRGHELLEIVTGKRRVSGQRLVQHARQRIDIDGGCGYLSANPFGRHVIQGADLGPRRRQPGVALGLGDSEVDQIYKVGGGDDDVLWLDVAVDQSLGVCRIQGGGDLTDDGHRTRGFQRALRNQVEKRLPLYQPHVDVQAAVNLTPVMDRNDVWFLQDRRRLRLALEPRPKGGAVGILLGEYLQRDSSSFAGVIGFVHRAAPAPAEQARDLVLAERRTDA